MQGEPKTAGRHRYPPALSLKACLTRLLFMSEGEQRNPEMAPERRDPATWLGLARRSRDDDRTGPSQLHPAVCRDCSLRGTTCPAISWRPASGGVGRSSSCGILAAYGSRTEGYGSPIHSRDCLRRTGSAFAQDLTGDLSGYGELAVSLEQVRSNFSRYDLLDDQVEFLEGWFKAHLARRLPIEALSVLRLDGDYYESTIQTLEALYERVSGGGIRHCGRLPAPRSLPASGQRLSYRVPPLLPTRSSRSIGIPSTGGGRRARRSMSPALPAEPARPAAARSPVGCAPRPGRCR